MACLCGVIVESERFQLHKQVASLDEPMIRFIWLAFVDYENLSFWVSESKSRLQNSCIQTTISSSQ